MRTLAYLSSLLLIFMIPWEDVINLPTIGTAAKSVGILMAVLWLGAVLLSGKFRKPAPFHIVAGIFILWNVASILWSNNSSKTINHLITIVQLYALTVILWDLCTTELHLLTAMQMYILGAYVASGNTLYNYFSGTSFYYERFSADGTNPDDLGIILAIGLGIAWYLAVALKPARFAGLLRVVNYSYIPVAFLGIALSGTRTALLATLPGVLFGLASLTRLNIWTRVAIFVLMLGAGYLLLPYVPEASLARLGSTGSEISSGDLNGRLEIWRQGYVSFTRHPILGVGAAMFRSINTVGKSVGKVAHNTYLSVLVEVGLVGFSIFALMLIIVGVQAIRQPRWESRLWLATMLTWALGAFSLTWENRKQTWLVLGLIIVSSAIAHQTAQSQLPAALAEPDEEEDEQAIAEAIPSFG